MRTRVIIALASAWVALAVFLVAAWRRINGDEARWRIAALLLVLAFSLIHQLLFRTVVEDAYITFRYAEQVATGNGPVFNAGERVEGYSDFLWLVLLAFAKTLFGVGVVPVAITLGMLCTLASALVAYSLVKRVVRDARPAGSNAAGLGVLAAALTAGASGLAAYGMSGLPASLFLLLVLGVCYALASHHPVAAGVLVALAMMTRPDGAVIAVVALAWLVFNAIRGRTDWWSPGGYTLGALVFLLPWTAWRVTYYGEFVPSVLAIDKPDPGRGLGEEWQNLSSFVLAHHGVLLLAVAAIAALALRRQGELVTRRARGLVWLILGLTIVYVAAILATRGEMPDWRLLAPVPPLLAVAATAAYGVLAAPGSAPTPRPRPRPLSTTRRAVPAAALVLCGVSLVVSVLHPAMLPAVQDSRRALTQAAEIGSWLEETLRPGTVISSYGNAALAYEAGTSLIVAGSLTEYRGDTPGARHFQYVANTDRPDLVIASTAGYVDRQHCGIAAAYAGSYQVATFRKVGTSKWIAMYAVAPRAAELVAALDTDPRFEHVPCPV